MAEDLNNELLRVTYAFSGSDADSHLIDLYDVAQALVGFHRTLAITTHLVLNGEVITQAPSLRSARILVEPFEEGSWKAITTVLAGLYFLGQAPQNSVIGHLLTSAYDYVISETLGFHVDFNKTLGQQYEELKRKDISIEPQQQSKFDAVIEKCENSIKEMHRPIVWSKTAESGSIEAFIGTRSYPVGETFDKDTFDYISTQLQSETLETFFGRVSSYNTNTYKGRIFLLSEMRPIPFLLATDIRDPQHELLIGESLTKNTQDKRANAPHLILSAYRISSQKGNLKGRLKSIIVTSVSRFTEDNESFFS